MKPGTCAAAALSFLFEYFKAVELKTDDVKSEYLHIGISDLTTIMQWYPSADHYYEAYERSSVTWTTRGLVADGVSSLFKR